VSLDDVQPAEDGSFVVRATGTSSRRSVPCCFSSSQREAAHLPRPTSLPSGMGVRTKGSVFQPSDLRAGWTSVRHGVGSARCMNDSGWRARPYRSDLVGMKEDEDQLGSSSKPGRDRIG
jgi:hypothetical protein